MTQGTFPPFLPFCRPPSKVTLNVYFGRIWLSRVSIFPSVSAAFVWRISGDASIKKTKQAQSLLELHPRGSEPTFHLNLKQTQETTSSNYVQETIKQQNGGKDPVKHSGLAKNSKPAGVFGVHY